MVDELNQSQWALIPKGPLLIQREIPEQMTEILGFALPYHSRRKAFVAGQSFAENLRTHWQPVGEVGNFLVYSRK